MNDISTELKLSDIKSQSSQELSKASDSNSLEQLRVKYLGKKGLITGQLKTLGKLSIEEKKLKGAEINEIKNLFLKELSDKQQEIELIELNKTLEQDKIDISLPSRQKVRGKIHPISQVIEELVNIMGQFDFKFVDGQNIEDDFHNFTALNIPSHHPAREMQDTFFINNTEGQEKVLRTQTSSVQIRTMEKGEPPFRIISAGRVYRSDYDQTHTPMFHQMECLCIDKNINMGHLKYTISEVLKKFFELEEVPLRFRPSYFPFTEPSAEVDIACKKTKDELVIGKGEDFLEILGCGMVNHNVLKNVGIDPKKWQGFAFGIGIERLAMLKYGVADLRKFFDGDIRFLDHYGFQPFDIPNLITRGK